MSITIESFTLEDDSTVAMATNVTDLFVEYSFLNYEYGELETPGSLPKPPPGEAAVYNFRKGTSTEYCITSLWEPYYYYYYIRLHEKGKSILESVAI